MLVLFHVSVSTLCSKVQTRMQAGRRTSEGRGRSWALVRAVASDQADAVGFSASGPPATRRAPPRRLSLDGSPGRGSACHAQRGLVRCPQLAPANHRHHILLRCPRGPIPHPGACSGRTAIGAPSVNGRRSLRRCTLRPTRSGRRSDGMGPAARTLAGPRRRSQGSARPAQGGAPAGLRDGPVPGQVAPPTGPPVRIAGLPPGGLLGHAASAQVIASQEFASCVAPKSWTS